MTTSGAAIAARAAGAIEGDRAARRAVEDEMAGDRDAQPIRVQRRPACRRARPPRPATGRRPRARPRSARRALPAAPAIRPQFGSRPWAAALTRLDEMTARATARASASSRAPCDRGGDQRRGPFAVGGLLAGEVAGDRLDGGAEGRRLRRAGARPARPRRAGRQHEDRVVGARVAVDRQLVPGPRRGGPQQAPQVGRLDGRIGQDDRQHRGHPRVDHPDALGDPADGHPDRAVRRASGSSIVVVADLGHRVGRAQRLGGGGQSGVVHRSRAGRWRSRPAATLSSGRRVPMTPVDRCRTRARASRRRRSASSRPTSSLVRITGRTRRRIRAAARGDDRLSPNRSRRAGRPTSPRGWPATDGPARPRRCSA